MGTVQRMECRRREWVAKVRGQSATEGRGGMPPTMDGGAEETRRRGGRDQYAPAPLDGG